MVKAKVERRVDSAEFNGNYHAQAYEMRSLSLPRTPRRSSEETPESALAYRRRAGAHVLTISPLSSTKSTNQHRDEVQLCARNAPQSGVYTYPSLVHYSFTTHPAYSHRV